MGTITPRNQSQPTRIQGRSRRWLQATGETERADQLFELVLEATRDQDRLVNPGGRVAGRVLDVAVHAWRSDVQAAAAALRDAHADGWRAAVWWS